LGEAYSIIAGILLKQGEVEESFDYFTKAHGVFAKLSSADPTNSLARDNVALMEISLGDVLLRKGKVGPSMAQDREAIATLEKIEHRNRYEIAGQADAYASMGKALCSLAGQSGTRNKAPLLRQSQSWYEKSLTTLQQEPGPKSLDPLSGDVTEQSVKKELSKCEESLAKLTVR
jgi:tetratricopeptide (TPR) repeat protein